MGRAPSQRCRSGEAGPREGWFSRHRGHGRGRGPPRRGRCACAMARVRSDSVRSVATASAPACRHTHMRTPPRGAPQPARQIRRACQSVAAGGVRRARGATLRCVEGSARTGAASPSMAEAAPGRGAGVSSCMPSECLLRGSQAATRFTQSSLPGLARIFSAKPVHFSGGFAHRGTRRRMRVANAHLQVGDLALHLPSARPKEEAAARLLPLRLCHGVKRISSVQPSHHTPGASPSAAAASAHIRGSSSSRLELCSAELPAPRRTPRRVRRRIRGATAALQTA